MTTTSTDPTASDSQSTAHHTQHPGSGGNNGENKLSSTFSRNAPAFSSNMAKASGSPAPTSVPSRPLSSIWSDGPVPPNTSNSPFAGNPTISSSNNMQGAFYGTPEKPANRNVSGPFDANGYAAPGQTTQAFSPSPTRAKFPPYQSGYGQGSNNYLSAVGGRTTGAAAGGHPHPSIVGAGDPGQSTGLAVQRSRSPNMGGGPNMGAGQTGVPNGRFLEINPGGIDPGYQGYGQTHQRIPTSPSLLGRSSDRVYGSAGSVDSVGQGLSSVGMIEGHVGHQTGFPSTSSQTDEDTDQDEDKNLTLGASHLDSLARRSPRPENAFEGGRKLWNAQGNNSSNNNNASATQIQGPGSLGGTPTRGVGGRPGVERTHSRFATAPTSAGVGQAQQGASGLTLGSGAGLDRPMSAMGGKGSTGGVAAGGVAGVTDASGRMEGQALIDLIARVARTEAAIADMSQQVASLNTIVKSLQISATQNGTAVAGANGLGSHSGSNSSSGGSTPSPFGPPQITRTSAPSSAAPIEGPPSTISTGVLTGATIESNSTITPTAGSSGSSSDVAALTHQIAALSASVAQLQRMQSTSVRQGMEKRMGQSGAPSPDEKTGTVPSASQSGTSSTSPGHNAPAGGSQTTAQTPGQGAPHQQQGYFPSMGGNSGRPQNARNQTGPAGGLNSSIASALGSIGSRPRPHPGRATSSSVVPGVNSAGGPGYQNMSSIAAGSERLGLPTPGGASGMSLGPMNMINQGAGGRIERDRLDAVTPGGMSREGGPGGMTVTKWEHLPLTPELQRQIVKYGIGPPNKIQARALPFMLRGSDIIAQAPPTQERIITYVIPVVQLVLSLGVQHQPTYKGPCAIIVTTTVDQATQAHKLIRDIGAPLGVRTGLAVGASGADISADLANWHRNAVHVLVGTPARLNDVMVKHASNGGLPGGEVRMLVLDEVDQLIARNLYENVTSICRVLPAPRSRNPAAGINGVIGTPGIMQSPGITSPFDLGMSSPFNPASTMPFPNASNGRFNNANSNNNSNNASMALGNNPERQTCIFSNTIPTDVINFSQSIQVREPVRVLVRREGGTNTSNESTSAGNLRHYYLYLALAGGAASRNEAAAAGPGTIGSGRAAGNQNVELNQAKEFKLEALADLLLEYPLWQAIIHVGAQSTLDAVVGKLNSRQMENLSLSPDMSSQAKQAVYTKWRSSAQSGRGPRFLVAFDTIVKPPEVVAAPLVVNFDLPRSVEGYAQRVSAANQADVSRNDRNRNGPAPSSIVLNFIQAAGGDVEMLRSTECAYRFKCSEIPASFRDLF